MKTKQEIRDIIDQSIGTDRYYSLGAPFYTRTRVTSGVKQVADAAGCWWLITEIASHMGDKDITSWEFMHWRFDCLDEEAGVWQLSVGDGNGVSIIKRTYSHDHIDFPLPEGISIWVENGIILLPNEH